MIGDLIRLHPNLTKPEPPSDLINGPHKVCECGGACCGSPLIDPNRKRP